MEVVLQLQAHLVKNVLDKFGGSELDAQRVVSQALSDFSGRQIYIPKGFGRLCSSSHPEASDRATE